MIWQGALKRNRKWHFLRRGLFLSSDPREGLEKDNMAACRGSSGWTGGCSAVFSQPLGRDKAKARQTKEQCRPGPCRKCVYPWNVCATLRRGGTGQMLPCGRGRWRSELKAACGGDKEVSFCGFSIWDKAEMKTNQQPSVERNRERLDVCRLTSQRRNHSRKLKQDHRAEKGAMRELWGRCHTARGLATELTDWTQVVPFGKKL